MKLILNEHFQLFAEWRKDTYELASCFRGTVLAAQCRCV
jgi:hypothetical protein